MFTWRRVRLVRALVGSAAAALAWWLFYLIGAWARHAISPVMFLCFFFTIVGIDRILGVSLEILVLLRRPSSRSM
jgi:hypothetical protein